jgi:hypothetical protein
MKLPHTFHLEPEVYDALTQKARAERRSTNAVVNDILKGYLTEEGSLLGLPLLLEPIQRSLERELSKLGSRLSGLLVRTALDAGTTRRVALHSLMLLLDDKKAAMQHNELYYTRAVEGLRKRLDELPELVAAFTAESTNAVGPAPDEEGTPEAGEETDGTITA